MTLTVSDTVSGCTDDANATVTITDPVANFTAAPTFGCGPLTVNFTDLSTGATTWNWDFGDGGTSNAQNPTHTYQNPGTYTVTLTIGDNNGCTDVVVQTNLVTVIGPLVDFVGVPLNGCDSITVNFTDLSTPGAPIVSWLWDFGDGNTSTLQNPTHQYLPGSWTVSLTVTDAVGCIRTLARPGYIVVQDPQAAFTINDTITCAGVALNFTNTSTGNALNYLWDFGDGNTSNAANPNHSYANNGNYTVTLSITDNLGCTDTVTIPNLVTISDVLANFGAIPTNASCPPLLVSFTDLSFWDIVSWDWDFGDATGSTLQNPAHVYTTAGSYDVSLAVVNDDGCTDTLLIPGLVNILGPNGNFTFDPDTGCTPQLVHFNATSTNTAIYTWDFGDGNVAITTVDSVDHVYTQTGTFFPILILDDGLGCTYSILSPDSIVIDTIPFVNFAVNANVFCGLDSVHFTDLTVSTRPITSWFWDFGDGNTDSVQNPVHFYTAPGTYTVTLGVVNTLGCTDTITLPANVSLFLPPTAAFVPSDTIGCDPFAVVFTDASTGPQPITGWNWDFGNGNTSTVQNPNQVFTPAGGYTITLIAIDSAGCRDTVSRNITVNPGPIANFVADDSLGCPPMPVQFTATTGMGIIAWEWNFGDGNFGSGPTTGHIYQTSGNFTVTLVVTDTLGCTDTLVKPQYIQINPPQANFTQGPTTGCPPLTVTFTDNSTGTNGIVAWAWDFGDGNTGAGTPVTHTYNAPGIYSVTLIVTDAQGCRDTLVKPNLVNVFQPPVADFGIIDTLNCDPFIVELHDGSTSAGSTIVGWQWALATAARAPGAASHLWLRQPGSYTISLTVTDANGCTGQFSLPIVAPAPPVASFVATDSLGCPGLTVTYTGDTTGGINYFEWDFGDGSPVVIGNPVTHSYSSPGDYTITLIVENAIGCRDTLVDSNFVRIHPPFADFLQNALSGCPPLTVTFTSLSTGLHPPLILDWDFGDGFLGTGTPVTHTYATPGIYTVTLVVTDSLGCRDTLIKPNLIEVYQPPIAQIVIVDTIACDPFTILLADSSTYAYPAASWFWTFGDGGTSTSQHPSHAYANPGPYTITLISTDIHGCQDTTSIPFVVPVRPRAQFSTLDSAGCAPFAVTFTADSTDIAGYFWDFGDGNTSNIGPVVTHSYLNPGHYTVSLIITDIYGCTDTLVRPNYIFVDSLVAAFTPDVGTGCPPLPVTFTDLSQSDTTIVAWLWTFGDGGSSNQQNPVHVYQTPGTYTVVLTVTNAIGCTASDTLDNLIIYNTDPPGVPPILMATVESNTADSISWRASAEPDFDHYVLWWELPTNSGFWVPVDSFFNRLDTTYTHTGLATLFNSYCYRLQLVDVCGYRSNLDSSQRHCTINLEASPGIDRSILNWNAYVGWDSVAFYDVFRVTSYDTLTAQYLGTVPGGVTTYIDSAVVCYEEYCYRVKARSLGIRRTLVERYRLRQAHPHPERGACLHLRGERAE
ncbi:MAG: PKD domain-containing protein [Bacteroidia bacterium]